MNEHQNVDGAIKALLDRRDDPSTSEYGRAVAARRLDECIAGRPPRRRRRRIAHPRLALAVACGCVLVSGVAVAATTTDLAERILGSKEPATERIGVLRQDPRPTMTQAELVATFRSAFVNRQVGERVQAELGQTLVGDDRARVSARGTVEGGVCMAVEEHGSPEPGQPLGWRPSLAACGTFEDGWPVWGAISTRATESLWYGLVADGVKQVRFVVEGETLDATMGEGSYMWRNPRSSKPSDQEAVLEDGTVVRRDLTWTYGAPPHEPAKPYIVSGQ